MKRREFIRGLGLGAVALGAQAARPSPKPRPARPNVILILTDDQGYGDLSCHGNPVLRTPNLDRLHGESVRFTDFHVAPMCSPTRGELMTGQQAFRNGAVFVCQGRSMIRRGIPTVADLFKAAGYATAQFGKWHLGDNCPYRPQDRGFDETIHHGAWGITSLADHWTNDYFDDIYEHNGVRERFKGYCTDVWFNEAMRWMAEQHDAARPFFCYIPTNVPHVPWIVESRYSAPYGGNKFFGMLAHFDEAFGRLEAFLHTRGLRDNTILIFMTDNGTSAGQRIFNAGMRGHKTDYYEGGHRVPFFLRWPAAGLDKPREVAELTHAIDLAPTLLDLCGIEAPADVRFDGLSLAPLIRGEARTLPDRKLIIQYRDLNHVGLVMWNRWRLVRGRELYNLADDPGQKKNLFRDNPDIARALRQHYDAWRKEIEPLQNQPNTISIGVDTEPVTFLSSANWVGSYADSWGNLRRGIKNGHWDLVAEKPGRYTIELYGWPKGSAAPFGARFKGIPGRQVARARLKLGHRQLEARLTPEDLKAAFTVELQKGEQPRLQAWLYDPQGRDLGGAYFVYVTRA